MKKALVVLIGVLMAVMFAAESYAETTVGGTIDVRGRWRENNNDLNKDGSPSGTPNGSTAWWDEKVNLWVDAKVAEGLKGYIELQSGGATSSKGWMKWGTSRSGSCGGSSAITTTACTTTASTDSAPNSMFNENRGFGFMEVRYAYIDFMIPGTPVGIKIGHMPVVVGHSIWADTKIWGSDGLMIYAMPIKELMIALGTIKGVETASNTDRSDIDMYGFHVVYTFMPKNSAGLNINYLLKTGDGNVDTTAGQADMHFWNVMLTADGALDFGLGYKFEIDKQFGKLNDTKVTASTLGDVKGSGLAFLAGADFKIADIAKVGMDVAYGSADKCATWASTTTGAACSSYGNKDEGYVNFNDYAYTMIYEDIVGQKISATALGTAGTYSGSRTTDFGLWNTMYAKLGAGVTPMKEMSAGLDIYYLRQVQPNYLGQKKNLGYEFDLNFGYDIYKNLKWTFLAGYFLPGNAYKAIASTDAIKDDAAWAFEQKLSLKF